MKRMMLSTLFVLAVSVASAQQVMKVGKGSYASYAPLAVSRSSEHAGDQSQYMQYRQLYVRESAGQPIPTNKWWTDLINADRGRSGKELTGHLWSYPQYVQGMKYGVDIHYPKYWIDNGTEMKAQSKLVVKATDFSAKSPMAETWSDWTVSFSETDGTRQLLTTLAHGAPFTWIETTNVDELTITAMKTDNDGADNLLRGDVSVDFVDGTGNAIANGTYTQFVVKISNAATSDLYGVYLPAGTAVTFTDGKAHLQADYLVVAVLKNVADLATYAPYAYSKPTDTQVTWSYGSGTVTTTYSVTAQDLRTGAATSNVLQGFIPHHYREQYATHSLSFLNGYDTPRGLLQVSAGATQNISYKFSGMLPWYALPTDADAIGFNSDRMLQFVADYAREGTFGDDTYWGGKGLTQMALHMMFAREMNDEALFDACHSRLKEALVNWLTYTPGERNFFFARDPRWGGLIGYATSYDSDTYNDHHFHYGYFTLAAALLAMVDDDFRNGYGDMMKLVARDYANYKRDSWAPHLRMFDAWEGHSYAGGLGDGAGNGQESTSEAMQGWGGLYLLGVALGDDEMRDAGIFGWTVEARATAEYWFDRHGEAVGADFHTTKTAGYNIDYDKFKHKSGDVVDYTIPYSSNLTSHGVGWWTWFGGDPVFIQGIQWMPISPALDYLGEDKAFAAWDYDRLMALKEHIGWDGTGGKGTDPGDLRNSDWGNVVLSYRQWSDPDDAATLFEQGWSESWGTVKTSSTRGITYFVTHNHRTYGDIDWTVSASIPTARVYKKGDVKTHMAYNPTNAPLTVEFTDGVSFEVPARQLKVKELDYASVTKVYPEDTSEPDLRERLVMPNLALGKPCTESSHQNPSTVKEHATDGDPNTRWGSEEGRDNEWIQVDLGENASIYKVRVKWETACASVYRIELRDTEDGDVLFSKTGNGKPNDWTELTLDDHQGRYVRLVGVERATQYGTSLYELEVYGRPASAADDDLMGVEIISADDVLKQGRATALTIQGYDYAKNEKVVSASWSSNDGTFSENNFTPAIYGMVSVTATTTGLTAVKTFPVEEALKLTSVSFVVPGIIVKDMPTAFTIEGKDQFGAPYEGEPTFDSDAGLTVNAAARTITATATGTYTLTAHMGGKNSEAEVLAIASAVDGPATLDDKVPVFVGEEESPMNFDYNGGSQSTGPSFLLTPNCRSIYVKKLGTCGFGALGNMPLEGANMLHADVYPLNDAPLFSIHIEGAPGNREYAKALTGGQWNSIDLPISNTTANWLFFSFNDYQAGTNAALIANVYFYTETGDRIYVSDPDSKGISRVTTFGTGVTDANVAQFLSDVAALPKTATAIDLSSIALSNSTPMTIATPNNPNVIILLNGSGGDDGATSAQLEMIANTQNIAYNSGGWILPMKATGFKVVFEDGYPVLPMSFGRNTTLTYSRTIAAGSYSTCCLPRTVAVPSGIVAYTLSSIDGDGLHFTKVDGTLAAYTPYLLHNTTEAPVELIINGVQGNVELDRGVNARSTTAGDVKFVGNFQQFRVTGSEGYAAFRSNGALAWLDNAGTTIGSFRAYLSGVTQEQLARGVIIDGETTGISEIEKVRDGENEKFFDLMGRKVAQPAKGLYIVNGRKVVIK